MDPIHIISALGLALALIGYVTCLTSFYWLTLILTAAVAAYLSAKIPMDAQTIPYWGAAGLAVGIAFVIASLIKPKSDATPKVVPVNQPGKRIVIDGTNVMYWDDETAQIETLRSVVEYLKQREFAPIVFLDASSRHHLKDTSLTEKGFARALGLSQKQVMVCPAGTEADVFILKFAKQEELPILSNDRFGDRAALVKGIKIVKGVITAGRPILDGL